MSISKREPLLTCRFTIGPNHRRSVSSAVFRFLAKHYIAASRNLLSPTKDIPTIASQPPFPAAGSPETSIDVKASLEDDWIYLEGMSIADVAEKLITIGQDPPDCG
ncbi:hypothetical protein FRC10_000603 [Ceratobasidium sp. 414]|nr:hypothetical protein FRC10_000603 [Ceratobasidium sp. 414]